MVDHPGMGSPSPANGQNRASFRDADPMMRDVRISPCYLTHSHGSRAEYSPNASELRNLCPSQIMAPVPLWKGVVAGYRYVLSR